MCIRDRLSRLVRCNKVIQKLLNIPVHNRIDLVQCQRYAVVGDAALWEIIGTDLLRAIPSSYLASPLLRLGVLALLQLNVIEL